jgi:hypothetical protein
MLTTDIYLNFKTGLDRYSGLFEIAKSFNIFEGGTKYSINGHSLGYRKDFEKEPELWDKYILPVLEPLINSEFTFHSEADKLKHELELINAANEIEKGVDELASPDI